MRRKKRKNKLVGRKVRTKRYRPTWKFKGQPTRVRGRWTRRMVRRGKVSYRRWRLARLKRLKLLRRRGR